MYQFYTPTVDYPAGNDRLLRRYRIPTGVSVIRNLDGSYRTQEIPTEDDFKLSSKVYLGGHVHLVTNEEAAELMSAGFGAGLVAV